MSELTGIPGGVPASRGAENEPWQLKMFSKGLKKQQKLRLLERQLGDTEGLDCLLITNGDNNGALNHHLGCRGGHWTWVENEAGGIAAIEDLLGQPVLEGSASSIPVSDASYDVVVSVDVHEHLNDCAVFNRELARVVRPGGRVIVTTPNGDESKPVCVLKRMVGMSKESYGHRVIGYTIEQHQSMLRSVGLELQAAGSYAGFFTELLELMINFTYVKILSRKRRKSDGNAADAAIVPTTKAELDRLRKQYRAYSLAFPVLKTLSRLDVLCRPFTGYAVSVVACRPAPASDGS